MSMASISLIGHVSEISRGRMYEDQRERVTVVVEGAEPLCAELRLRNYRGRIFGQKLEIAIGPASSDELRSGA